MIAETHSNISRASQLDRLSVDGERTTNAKFRVIRALLSTDSLLMELVRAVFSTLGCVCGAVSGDSDNAHCSGVSVRPTWKTLACVAGKGATSLRRLPSLLRVACPSQGRAGILFACRGFFECWRGALCGVEARVSTEIRGRYGGTFDFERQDSRRGEQNR